MNWETIWSWIEKNRFTVLCPLVGTVLWLFAASCTPVTQSPFHPDRMVTAVELEQEYQVWLKENEIVVSKFEFAGKDLQQKLNNQNAAIQAAISFASGNVADLPGLIQLLMGSGIVGLFADNIRKNGVIGGLKRNA